MSKRKSLLNRSFGRLTVKSLAGKNRHGNVIWECVCACGNVCIRTTGGLLSINFPTCGKCDLSIRNPIHVELIKKEIKAQIVLDANGCHLWTGKCNKDGYGILTLFGETRVHRIIYRIYKGGIPTGLCVCHACDSPACSNPDHLFVGSDGDNVRDKLVKNRQAKGASIGSAKLTAAWVDEIKRLHAAGNENSTSISNKFGVSRPAIEAIVKGKAWKYLEEEEEDYGQMMMDLIEAESQETCP